MSKKKRKAGSSPVNRNHVAESNSKKKKKRAQFDGVSGCSGAQTAMNTSDVGDFGGSMDNLTAAGPSAVKVKLPPLVVKNIPFDKLASILAKRLGVAAEYKLCGIGIKVMLRTKAEYDLVAAYLKDSKTEFFTHDIPGEKPFKVVIRGLPNYDPKAIEAEIKDRYKLAPIAVYRITRRDEKVKTYPDSLFLVHFQKGTVTLNALRAIRSLFSVIVRWEPYRGGHTDVTQCQRCLNFGHGTRNCNIKPRCSRCAKDHASTDCTVPVDGSVAVKCANCGGAHQGSDRQCPKRENFKLIRKQASTANQPGRKKERAPTFRAEDFPALPAARQAQANSRVQSAPPQETAGTSAGQRSPPPPGFWRPPTPQNNNPEGESLLSDEELVTLVTEVLMIKRTCKTRAEQLRAVTSLITKYGD